MRLGHFNTQNWAQEHRESKTAVLEYVNCDIIGINETHFKNQSDEINIDDYKWIGSNRKTIHKNARSGSGGIGVLIRHSVYAQFDIEVVDDSYDGVLAVLFVNKNSDYNFLFINAYLPPENSIYGRDAASFYSHILNLTYMYSHCDAIYFAGDVNGRVGSRADYISEVDTLVTPRTAIDETVNGHGESLLEFCNDSKFCIINGRFSPLKDNYTSVSTKGTAVVDYFLTRHSNLKNVLDFEVITMSQAVQKIGIKGAASAPNKISDHSLLIMDFLPFDTDIYNHLLETNANEVDESYLIETGDIPNVKLPPRFKITNVTSDFLASEQAKSELLQLIDEIEKCRNTQTELDCMYDRLCDMYVSEMGRHFRVIDNAAYSKRKFKCTQKEWWDDELTSLWQEMQQAEHNYIKAKRNKLPHKQLHNSFRYKQDTFDKSCKRKKRSFHYHKCTKLEEVNSSDPKSFWEYIKKLGPNKKTQIPYECYGSSGEVITDTTTVLHKWQHDFRSLYSTGTTEDAEHQHFKETIREQNTEYESSAATDQGSPELNMQFSVEEISKVIFKAKNNKAPGLDGVVYDILKNDQSVELMTRLFNFCFDKRKVPTAWLQALIYPIPKSAANDPRIPLNYRGISLLSVVSKLYTSALNFRLNKFAENNNLFVNEQNGFRADRSCLDHIYVLQDILRIRKQLNTETYCAFVDFKKAFDFVDRDLLLYKLRNNGITGNFYHAIKSLYTKTQSCVQLNDKVTNWFPVEQGVRQGDSLSPTLFSLYLNDLAVEIKDLGAGVKLGNDEIAILLYADDIVLLAPTPEKLQTMLNVINTWCKKWGMQINASKTQILHVRNHQRPRSSHQFTCGDDALCYTEYYKYLGVMIHEHLNNSINVQTLTAAASRSFGRIHNMFKALKNMGPNTYETLYLSYVLPIANYASGVWGFDFFDKPQILQNRIIRFFLGVHKFAPLASTKIEMDWLEMRGRRWLEMLRLYNRIAAMPDWRLPKLVYKWDISLGLNSWAAEVQHIAASLGMPIHLGDGEVYDLTVASNTLLKNNRLSWHLESTTKPKLRTFIKIHDFGYVQTLAKANITRYQRSLLAQLKFGILPLKIETDRYIGIAPDKRLCRACDIKEPEDELHFLFKCPSLNDTRMSAWHSVYGFTGAIDINSNDLIDTFKTMLSVEHIQATGKFIELLYKKRQKILYN